MPYGDKEYSAIKRLLFSYDIVFNTSEEYDRFMAQLALILKI